MIPGFIRLFGSQKRIAGGAAVLALTQFGASLAGLFRDRILAATFPPGADTLDVVSVYIAAFRPSDLLFQMLVMSAFSVALVPLLASHLAHGRREEMDRLLTAVMTAACVLFGALALLLALFFDDFAPLLVDFKGESLQLYVRFGRLALFTNFLFVAGNAFGQYLITRQTYWMYGITPILYTLGTIAGTVWLTPVAGPYGPMYGTALGALVYAGIRAGACLRGGFAFRTFLTPVIFAEMRHIGWLMLPRMAALGAMQAQLLLFDNVASGLPLGSVTINAYARNFQAVAVGVVGIALAQSLYSLLSQAAGSGERRRFLGYLKKGTLLTLGLTVPGAIALALLAPVAARIVHLTDMTVAATFVVALGIYCISVPFESLNHLLLRAVYATKHTAAPALSTVVNGAIAIAVAWVFSPAYGVYSLAAGFVAGQAAQTALLSGFLGIRVRFIDLKAGRED